MSAAALAVGAAVQGGISAAQSAAQAALVGDDPGEAAWKNAVAGGTSFLGGSLISAGVGRALTNAAFSTTSKAVIRGVAAGAGGGALGGGITAGLDDSDESVAFSDVFQGIAFGVLGGIFPEVIAAKQEARVALLRRTEQMRLIGNNLDNDAGFYGTL